MSLGKLYARSFWHTLTGGTGGLNLWGPDEEEIGTLLGIFKNFRILTFYLVVKPRGRQIDEKKANVGIEEHAQEDDQMLEEEDGPWYFGKAKEDFNKRRDEQAVDGRRRDDEDPIQVGFVRSNTISTS